MKLSPILNYCARNLSHNEDKCILVLLSHYIDLIGKNILWLSLPGLVIPLLNWAMILLSEGLLNSPYTDIV